MTNRFLKLSAALLVAIGLTFGVASFEAQAQSKTTTTTTTNSQGAKPSPTPKPPKPTPTPKPPKPTPTPKPGKCTVCDRAGGKPKEKQIPCDKVDEYLQQHPTATRGPCNVTPVTNP